MDNSLSSPFRHDPEERELRRPSSMSRSAKVIIFILVVSNIASGIFSFYSLRALDAKYSALLAQSVPTLNDLQTLTAMTVETMRSTNPSVLSLPNQDSIVRARQLIQNEEQLRRGLLQRHWLRPDSEERLEFERAGDALTRAATSFVDSFPNSAPSEMNQQRDEVLRPAFQRYQVATTKAADALEADSLQTSNALTTKTGSVSRLILAAGTWPLAILFTLVLASALVLLYLARFSLFKKEESWPT
jgi:hypothetical protein